MNTILAHRPTSSAIGDNEERDDVAVAAGLLVDAVFGTNAGLPAPWRLHRVAFVMTAGPTLAAIALNDATPDPRVLRDRIAARGLSKQEIARAIGVDRRSLSGYASHEIRPTPERLALLRILAELVDEIEVQRPGRVRDVLLSRRGGVDLLDQLNAAGDSILDTWRQWVARSEASVSVTSRARSAEPIWAAAARAVAEGRLAAPSRSPTVRPESTYEMDLGEAASFAEPEYTSRRQTYR
jgi:transcriptional regulator with XRE-family HTH domain